MSETYCGKICSDCVHKELLNCPGCKAGPGRPFGDGCELAKCCRDKGHETCDTCAFKGNCATLRSREDQPENRRRKIEAEQRQKEVIAKRAPILGKWLWILFWLVVPTAIAGLMGNKYVMKISPGIYTTGQVMSTACSIAYGAILFRISSEEARYRIAGICSLVSAAVSIFMIAVFGAAEVPTWTLIITLPTAILVVVGEYHEYSAHAAVLTGIDEVLPEKWATLRKWYVISMLGIVSSALLIWIALILGTIVLLGGGIGVVIVSIVKLVYLYRTARAFREYAMGEMISAK